MIRRGFWVAVGAAIGVSGYRRASRLARTVFPARPGSALATGARPTLITGRSLLAAAASAGRGTAQGVAFARDVREGVAEYLERQGDQAGRTLDISGAGSGPALVRSALSRPGRCAEASAPAPRPDDSH
jgi:hypothetical protein